MIWITRYWAKIGGVLALAIFIYVLLSGFNSSNIQSLLWLHLVTLLIHQFEEYVYPGGFKEFFNENIYNKNPIIRSPLNDRGIILVNVVLGWSAYLISAVVGSKALWLAFGLVGVTVLNGFMHTMMFVLKRKYNPGFFSGFFLMIPFGAFLLVKLLTIVTVYEFNNGVFVFVIGTALIPLSIYMTNLIKST